MADHPSELSARREAEIARGALPLFLEKGFHATSIREIAAAAGLSMGGLYEYISSKDDVLSLVYRQMTSPFDDVLGGGEDLDLRKAIADAIEASRQRAKEVQILYRETVALDGSHREDLARNERGHAHAIADAIVAGVKRGDYVCLDPLLVGHMVIYLTAFMPLRSWIMRPDGIEPGPELADAVADLVMRALHP